MRVDGLGCLGVIFLTGSLLVDTVVFAMANFYGRMLVS
jgi:hypothetical protein